MAEIIGYALFVFGLIILGLLLYSVFCYMPSEGSRKEEKEEKKEGK